MNRKRNSNSVRFKILLFMPSLDRDKQLELFIESSSFDLEIVAIKSDSRALIEYCRSRNIRLHTFSHSRSLINFIQVQFLLKRVIRDFSPNLVESHSFLPGLYLGVFKILHFVFKSAHFTTANFRHHNLNHHLKRNRRAIFLDRFIYTSHDTTVVPSSSTFSVLIAEGCNINKLSLIPHQLSLTAIQSARESGLPKYSIESNKYELIAVGRLDWQKNYALMMNVLYLLKSDVETFRLRIFGSGSDSSKECLLELVHQFGLDGFVSLENWTPSIEIEILRSDVFLHTSIDESFGLVLAESLALGTPVVSNWMGGARDLASISCTRIAGNSAEELHQLLKETLLNLPRISIETRVKGSEFLARLNSADIQHLHKRLAKVY
jgi:glycosyltransferase involved in cell wall biosynthesis